MRGNERLSYSNLGVLQSADEPNQRRKVRFRYRLLSAYGKCGQVICIGTARAGNYASDIKAPALPAPGTEFQSSCRGLDLSRLINLYVILTGIIDLAPIALYDSDPRRALRKVFDRATGKPIGPEQLKTYAEVLAQYHLSSEDKFKNGQFLDRGRTIRRHIVATGFAWIGKEANQVGESGEGHPIRSATEQFNSKGLGRPAPRATRAPHFRLGERA
jgi:hypothetical protein